MKVRGTRTGRWLLLTGVGLLGLLVGVGLGGASVPAKTTTSTISTTVHETATVTTQKIVRKPPVTITRTETKSVLKGGDNAFDYGSYQGEFEVRGLRGDNTDLGGRILGQIRSPSGCGGYVQIDATFYKGGAIVDTEITNFESMPAGSWLPFEITAIQQSMDSYDLVLTQANC
jgi:hypothetical protein